MNSIHLSKTFSITILPRLVALLLCLSLAGVTYAGNHTVHAELKFPKLADAAIHAGPAFAQFLSGRLFLRPGTGESSIFVISKDS